MKKRYKILTYVIVAILIFVFYEVLTNKKPLPPDVTATVATPTPDPCIASKEAWIKCYPDNSAKE